MLSSLVIGRKVARIMNDLDADAEFERTGIPEIATWINEACLEIVRLKPSELTARVAMKLTPGSTRQRLAVAEFVDMADGTEVQQFVPLQLLDVGRNMGADGMTPGTVTRKIEQQAIDGMLPDWHTRKAEKEIRWVIVDPNEKMAFQVCFQAPATDLYVEVLVSRKPFNILLNDADELGTDDIDAGLSDALETAVAAYVAHKVLAKDSTSAVNEARSQSCLRAFGTAIGVEVANDNRYPERKWRRQQAPAEEGTPQQ